MHGHMTEGHLSYLAFQGRGGDLWDDDGVVGGGYMYMILIV